MGLITGFWFFIVCMTLLVLAISALWILYLAFAEHFVWGLAVLFIPMVYVVFAALNWEKAGKPFLIGLAATGLLCIEWLIAGGVAALFGG